jgi:RHS repeat-associated protein
VQKTIDGETYRLSYDTAHQLKSAEGSEGLREFTYDKAGRLVTEVLNGQPAGNYTYGYLDKVIAVERNGEVTRFDYDAQGMLVGKQLPDGSYEHWVWDGMALVARGEERYINEGHITGGLPLVSQTSEGVQYHQHDHLGTTVASYSTDGAIISAYETTVFGQGELEDSRSARFTGKPYDADLGAYVFPFRYYDPESARWLSADPSGFPDGPNQHYYACVPTMGVDPLGLLTVNTTQDVAESWNAGVNNLKTTTYTQTTSYDWNAENTALVGSISYQANPGFQGDPGPVSWTDQSHPYEVTFSFNNVDTSGVEDADPTGNRVGEWRQYVVRTTLNLLMTTKTWDTYNDPETNEVSYDPDVFETEANEMMDNDPHTESGDIYEL